MTFLFEAVNQGSINATDACSNGLDTSTNSLTGRCGLCSSMDPLNPATTSDWQQTTFLYVPNTWRDAGHNLTTKSCFCVRIGYDHAADEQKTGGFNWSWSSHCELEKRIDRKLVLWVRIEVCAKSLLVLGQYIEFFLLVQLSIFHA